MKKSKFTEAQIAFALKQAETGKRGNVFCTRGKEPDSVRKNIFSSLVSVS